MDLATTFQHYFYRYLNSDTNWKSVLFTFLAIWFAYSQVMARRRKNVNREKIAKKRREFESKKDRLWKKLTSNGQQPLISKERESILSLPILQLADKLRNDVLDPVDVLQAYQAKALEATSQTNCVVDFIDESLEQAEMLRSVPLAERGPLHGLPISLKECFHVKGYDCTIGMARYIGRPSAKDGVLIKAVKETGGGVPFCLTNVPQTMFSFACSNPVYGVTTHPKDQLRTPGGSSGGEACLITQGGSVLGLGSDVGGSLRIPSHFCGIAALKPTSGRICERGRSRKYVPLIGSNAGFMCRSVDGVVLGMKTMLDDAFRMADRDHSVVPINWRQDLFTLGSGGGGSSKSDEDGGAPKRKLRIGWYDSDGFQPAVPGCRRAVQVAVESLRSRGHEVVHFQPPHLTQLVRDFFNFMLADLGQTSLDVWKDEILDQSIEVNNLIYKMPFAIRKTLFKFLLDIFAPSMGKLADCGLHKTCDVWMANEEFQQRKADFLEAWQNQGLDVVIAPAMVAPAMPLADPARLVPATSYTVIYNVLDLPVGTLPVDVYNKQDQEKMSSYPQQDLLHKIISAGVKDGASAVGLPLGVQVIGRPWQEELVLNVMKQIQDEVNFDAKYSHHV